MKLKGALTEEEEAMSLKDKWKHFAVIAILGTTLPYLVDIFSEQTGAQDEQASSTAHRFWNSPDNRFGAALPGEVERVTAEGKDGEIIGYIAIEETSQGGTVYQISHYALSPKLEEIGSHRALKAILTAKSRMLAPTVPLEMEWQPFGKNNESLHYQQTFEAQGVKVRERGFMLTHQGEVIEVKTQSTFPKSQQNDRAVEQFLNSFSIITP